MATIGKQTPNNKTTAMSKRRKQTKRPSGRDLARSFIEMIIAKGKEFERMKQEEERNR